MILKTNELAEGDPEKKGLARSDPENKGLSSFAGVFVSPSKDAMAFLNLEQKKIILILKTNDLAESILKTKDLAKLILKTNDLRELILKTKNLTRSPGFSV